MPSHKITFEDGTRVSIEGDAPPTHEQVAAVWWDIQRQTSAEAATDTQLEAFGKAAANVVPETAGGLAGAGVGAMAGSIAGPLGTLAGGLIGAFGGAAIGGVAKKPIAEAFVSEDAYQAFQDDIAKNEEAYPLTTFAAELAPAIATMRFSPMNVNRALKTAEKLRKGGLSAMKNLPGAGISPDEIRNLINVGAGSTISGVSETIKEATDDKEGINGLRIAGNAVLGAYFNDPNRVGRFLLGQKAPLEFKPVNELYGKPRPDGAIDQTGATPEPGKAADALPGAAEELVEIPELNVVDKGDEMKLRQSVTTMVRQGLLTDEMATKLIEDGRAMYPVRVKKKAADEAYANIDNDSEAIIARLKDPNRIMTDADNTAGRILLEKMKVSGDERVLDLYSAMAFKHTTQAQATASNRGYERSDLMFAWQQQRSAYRRMREEAIAKNPLAAKQIPVEVPLEAQKQVLESSKIYEQAMATKEVIDNRAFVRFSKDSAVEGIEHNQLISEAKKVAGNDGDWDIGSQKTLEDLLTQKYKMSGVKATKLAASFGDNYKVAFNKARGRALANLAEWEKTDLNASKGTYKQYIADIKKNINAYTDAYIKGGMDNFAAGYTDYFTGRLARKGGVNAGMADPRNVKDFGFLDDAMQRAFRGKYDQHTRLAADLLRRKAIIAPIPTPILEKTRSFQTIMMLLNIKTPLRNIIGNTFYAGFRGLANQASYVMQEGLRFVQKASGYKNIAPRAFTPIDPGRLMAASLDMTQGLGGKIEQGVLAFAKQAGMAEQQAARFARESTLDVLRNTSISKMDANVIKGYARKAFNKGLMKNAEDALTVLLGTADSSTARAAEAEALRTQIRLYAQGAIKEISPVFIAAERARAIYQDDTTAGKALEQIRKFFNLGKAFGVGDLLIKFPKTPGSILTKGVEFSPLGFIKTAYEVFRPTFAGEPIRAREMLDSLGKAFTGTAVAAGIGYWLRGMNIITPVLSEDKDIAATQRAQGLQEASINISALGRALLTGNMWTPQEDQVGDAIMNYAWAQPMSLPLTMGARAFEREKSLEGETPVSGWERVSAMIENGRDSALTTIANEQLFGGFQKALQGMKYTAKDESPVDAVANGIFTGAVQTFIPSIVRATVPLVDNSTREVDRVGLMQNALDGVKNSIPWLSESLPARYTNLGDGQQRFMSNSNNLFSVLVNPSITTYIQADPVGQEVLRLYKDSAGDLKSQAPSLIGQNLTVKQGGENKKLKLTTEQKSQYQELIGRLTVGQMMQEIESEQYAGWDDDKKAKALAKIVSQTNTAVKSYLFGHEFKPSSNKRAFQILQHLRNKENILKQ